MAENVIIAGKKKNTEEMEKKYIKECMHWEETTVIFYDKQTSWENMFPRTAEVHFTKSNIRYAELLKKSHIPSEQITDMIKNYIEWEKRHILSNMEYLILSLMVEVALSETDFFASIQEIETFEELVNKGEKVCKEKVEIILVREREARISHEYIKKRLPELGFYPESEDIKPTQLAERAILLIPARYGFICALFLECLYKTAGCPMSVFVPEHVRPFRPDAITRAKRKSISTYITVPSIDFITMYYKGQFQKFIQPFDRVLLCGEQMLRKKTVKFLARINTMLENECRMAERISNLKDQEVYIIEKERSRKQKSKKTS